MKQLTHRPNAAQRVIHIVVRVKAGSWFFAPILHHLDRPILRLSRGRYSLTSVALGLPVVTVTTIGAKTGQRRSLPLIAIPDGENVILIASNFGQKQHPAWYYNICAHPEVQLTYERQTITYTASETCGEERERCWQRAVSLYSGYARYQERVGQRQIGVFLLTPQAR